MNTITLYEHEGHWYARRPKTDIFVGEVATSEHLEASAEVFTHLTGGSDHVAPDDQKAFRTIAALHRLELEFIHIDDKPQEVCSDG